MAGEPASQKDVASALTKADKLMAAYFKLTSTSKPSDFKRVFAMNTKDVSWKGPEGTVPVGELNKQLDDPAPILTPVAFVVAGDAGSARGVWLTTTGEDGTKPLSYAVDFISVANVLFGSNWYIWHMSIQPAETVPPIPAAYCHFDPDQAF